MKETTTAIVWEKIGVDDFIARPGNYLLRVERMTDKRWWWSVDFGDDFLSVDSQLMPTEQEAKEAAEKCYKEHRKKRNEK